MIKFKNLSFSYDNKKGINQLKNINLEIKKGEFVLLCGKSGCGKTSLLRLINGLIPNYYEGEISGEVLLLNEDIKSKEIYEVSKIVSTVFQNPKSQFFNLDTTSEILFSLENHGVNKVEIEKRLDASIKAFDISKLLDKNIFELSGGEKQKIAVASAYASNTDIVLFDEPTSNLDMESIDKIREMLMELKNEGKTIIISEHRLYFLKDLIDRAIYIENGEIKKEFSKEEFSSLSEVNRIKLGLRKIEMNNLELNNKNNINKSKKLEIKKLKFNYSGLKKFKLNISDIMFNFGSIVGIIGKNGQGKSTFANSLIGLQKKGETKVFIDKKRMKSKKRLEKSYLVMQNVGYQLFTESVEEELKLGANKELYQNRVKSVLTNLNIDSLKEAHPLSLSGGQQQRVSIGAGICSGSEILCFDEPTSGMDYFHMIETAKIIKSISNKDNIIFIISHDLEFLYNTVDTIIRIDNGQIEENYKLEKNSFDKIVKSLMN